MKIGQLVYVVKDGKATIAIITNRRRRKRITDYPKFTGHSILSYFLATISCNSPLRYEIMYNDNTRENVPREQLEMY